MTIPLPEDLSLEPAAPALPQEMARFHGCWLGDWDGNLPHLLVVERIAADGAVQAVYALGDAGNGALRRQWMRLQGRITEGRLHFSLPGVALQYRFEDGRLHGHYHRLTLQVRAVLEPVPPERLEARLAEIPVYHPLASETLLIPSHVASQQFGRPLHLAATYFRPEAPPAGRRRPPLLVFNHGSTGPGLISPQLVLRHEIQARYFLARGFAVLSPMRRGRGASEGDYVEWYSREPLKLAEGLRNALEDIDAVIAFMRQREDIDGRRILVAGQSRGGLLSIAYAGQRPPGVVGCINFAGGWIAEHGMIEDFNRDAFVRAGAGAGPPSLWLYAENDSLYDPAAIRRWHDGYMAAGGEAQLYLFPPLRDGDGHALCDRPQLWQSAVDAYLHQLGFLW